ncbi:MAG: DUF1778 domain-containing protein [Nitriliruptor sp.]|uniref:DUF1778 domain-containing protein n=1 Tax=Nitriliruptor sp. TaxID=2448056 RepID=UPI0034A09309
MEAATKRAERSERLGFRVTPEQKEVLAEAAALSGEDVTSFVLSRALRDAQNIVLSSRVTIIADEAAADFHTWLYEDHPRVIPEMSKRLGHIEPFPVASR